MPSIYSKKDLQRKINSIKDRLYKDGFYDSKVVVRYLTETVVNDDPFKVKNTNEIKDYIIECIIEKNPEYVDYNKTIEAYNGNIRVTLRKEDRELFEQANEIWVDVDFNVNGAINYETENVFTQGIRYTISNKKPSILEYDQIYILKEMGKLNGEIY
ncbi:MAG: hypothetical protein PHN69_02440 [Candidatus Pacebacteria bacterium]|nr:hypothetical protein [Candidatus Paceibacterota bacterium]